MVSVYQLKSRFQSLLRPLVKALAKAGVTANSVTVAAIALSAATGVLCLWVTDPQVLYLLPVCLFARMALNAVDGMLAREHDQKSVLGGFLNELGDVVSDVFLYAPLALRPEFPFWPTLLLCFVGVLTEFTGVVAVAQGGSRRYDGPMGKSDRAFLFGAVGLVLGYGISGFLWVSALIWLGVVLGLVTVARRVGQTLEEIESCSK